MSIPNLQKGFLKRRFSLRELQNYAQKTNFYKNIENMEEIFDTIPATGDYTMYEKQVAETLAREIFQKYRALLFDEKIALSRNKVIFQKEVEDKGVLCGAITYGFPAIEKLSSILLSITMIRNSYRLRKNLLHEMCHAYGFFAEDPEDTHGKIWRDNVKKAKKKLKATAELRENLNVTTIPPEPEIFNCYPPKFLYECEHCHKFTEKATNTRQCKRCEKNCIILVRLNEISNKVGYTREGAQRKLFFRYEIWKRLKRTGPSTEVFRDATNVISRSTEIVGALRNEWNDMNDDTKDTYEKDLHFRFVTSDNLAYFNELLS